MSKELLEAASNGEIDKVKKLLDQENIDSVDKNGNTALCLAVKNGHENIADFLIKKNANVNVQNKDGWTALNHAIASNRLNLFELIMTKKQDFTAKAVILPSLGKTHTALCHTFQVVGLVTSPRDLTQESIAKLARYKDILEKMAKQLIAAGANIKEISQINMSSALTKSTAFSLAIEYRSIAIANVLPGDFNEEFENDYTHLQHALLYRDIPMACLLVEKGANLNPKNDRGSPWDRAVAIAGSERLVQLFIEKGADVNQLMDCNYSPLILALSVGNIQVAQLLIERGAKITDEAKDLALEKINSFHLIVKSTIKNRSKEVSEQEILHQFFNKILKLPHDGMGYNFLGASVKFDIKSLTLYLLECGLEMPVLPEPGYASAYQHRKVEHPAYVACREVLRLFESNNLNRRSSSSYLSIDHINSEIESSFRDLRIDGKIVCLNYRRIEDGNTWLHVAINDNLNLATALILLGSRLDIPNKKNETVAELIRKKPYFLIFVKIKLLRDWVDERNARATKNTTEISNLPPPGISLPTTSLVDVKMEKDRPIFNQYNVSNATAATGTATSSGAAASSVCSLPNAKEKVEDAFSIKVLNEIHNVEVMIKQIYDDISKVQPEIKHFLVSLVSNLIVANPDLFNSLLGFAYKFFSEIEPGQPSSVIKEFCLANEHCFKLLSMAYNYKYQFKSENQDSKLTIIPCQNKQVTGSLEIENRRLMKKYQMKHKWHQINSGNSDVSLLFEYCESESEKDLKSLQDQQNKIEKLQKDLEKSQHENALLKKQIQDLQKTTQGGLLAGYKRKQK